MVQRVQGLPGVRTIRCDQCYFGQYSYTNDGQWAYARKTTGVMGNCDEILDELGKQCPGNHFHQRLIGGRAIHCATYPPRLVAAIIRGLKKALERIGRIMGLEAGPTVEEKCPVFAAVSTRAHYDEVTGVVLPQKFD